MMQFEGTFETYTCTYSQLCELVFQDKLYPEWNKRLRKIWKTGWTRIYMFWIVLIIATAIVATGIISDFIRWDSLNRDFVSTNELSRAFLASFILVMDLLIVMQVSVNKISWATPQCMCRCKPSTMHYKPIVPEND